MEQLKGVYEIKALVRVLGLSESGFYQYQKRSIQRQERAVKRLDRVRKIEKIFLGSNKIYGSPRVFAVLKGLGERCSLSTVERLMREENMHSKTKKKFRIKTTDSAHSNPIEPNKLNREFNPENKNKVWASDITYIPTGEGFLFLCVFMDLFSRKIVGWSMGNSLKSSIVINALNMAINREKPNEGLMAHSDRGVQYTSQNYRELIAFKKFILSHSRKGNCHDNAVVESFFHSLKTEFTYFENFKTREEAQRRIFEWIEVFYNKERIHSFLGYKSPVEYEKLLAA